MLDRDFQSFANESGNRQRGLSPDFAVPGIDQSRYLHAPADEFPDLDQAFNNNAWKWRQDPRLVDPPLCSGNCDFGPPNFLDGHIQLGLRLVPFID